MNIDIIPQDQLARLSQLISDAETILITCHKSPDGDAIGSSLGLADYLRHLGKEPIVIVPDQYPDFLMWLPNTEKIIRYDKQRDKADLLFKIADLIFCLDYNAPSRVDEMEQSLVGSPATRVLIDHHLNPDVPADFIISEPEASSTCELVFRLVWQMGAFPILAKQFAVPIYHHQRVAHQAHRQGQDLPQRLSQLLRKPYPPDGLRDVRETRLYA